MTKTLAAARRQERVKFKVPRSVQDAIPIRRIWPDGIFQVGNQYSKSWSFTDINYAIADKDDKWRCSLTIAPCSTRWTPAHRPRSPSTTAASTRWTSSGRCYCHCTVTPSTTTARNSTRCCAPRSPAPATAGAGAVPDRQHRQAEHRRSPHLLRPRRHRSRHPPGQAQFGGSGTVHARPAAFTAGFLQGRSAAAFDFDLRQHAKRGHSFEDWLCPDSMEFASDHFQIDGRFGRVRYLRVPATSRTASSRNCATSTAA